ncbi:16S rRNA (adenine(1518)-N(6)/adenine(1519)-N(6))-dimethyltransferase RsmA [Psychroflexus sp. CAK57W]|uniref:16S rRNA (adenine(1518)-N(6)/adenine(1519)-N(6))- dimethyltransferase RsmA n=1 Tax=Psychroflexus curvus TaxID=2873595 RepID=UPI001CCE4EC6|nr:16S rRNA (adenine(1518)-N(6)/adenine(1519)-N(6))-dimethyltransferase RsmA [Psychroflexus curvus]MBZ9788318.1 16S rRNA (adenine(1518)-N(6)/adenine(1519)-N(6))-dimethyltransferase RsmA [Psychroflexus curvus]
MSNKERTSIDDEVFKANFEQGVREVKAKKHLGQHFLTDEEISERIAQTLQKDNYNNLLEIGPGTGVLTKYLLNTYDRFVAMDLDRESIAYLNSTFKAEHDIQDKPKALNVVEADFLKVDLSVYFGEEQFAIIGNFPYNISTQIVFKALENKQCIPEFSGMFQKEVAERICAKEGSKTYGILSVLVQAFYTAEYLFTVPPEAFDPPPKIHSGVLRLQRKENYELPCEEKKLRDVVKTAFQQRRKTLRNSLKKFNLSPELREDSIFAKRPEQLSVEQFIELTLKISKDAI